MGRLEGEFGETTRFNAMSAFRAFVIDRSSGRTTDRLPSRHTSVLGERAHRYAMRMQMFFMRYTTWSGAAPHGSSSRIARSSLTLCSAMFHASLRTAGPLLSLQAPKPSCLTKQPRPFSSKATVILVGKRGVSKDVGSGTRYELDVG